MKALSLSLALCFITGVAPAGTLLVTVLDKDGKPVPDAVVSVNVAKVTGEGPALPKSATIFQEKMQFSPAVTVVPLGAKVSFVNNDSWDHHVRGTRAAAGLPAGTSSGGFELRLDGRKGTAAAKTMDVVLEEPGPVLLSCHIHGSMRGHVFVASSPWTAKTSAEGQVLFETVPDGPAQVSVWHPEQLLDLPVVAAQIGAPPARVGLSLQIVPRRRRI